MARKKRGRPITGIILLDKPSGITSNSALQKVKRLFNAQKAGHTGILDPMASGVLPVCLGDATKFSQYLLDSDKAYKATVRFGEKTDTADAEGEIIERCDASDVTQELLESVLPELMGEQDQVPPMYSALKKDGQPLYKLARQGIEVERKARRITILELRLEDFRVGECIEADIYVKCTKGTYIRTLAEDIAAKMGNLAHLVMLRRVQTCDFHIDQCLSLEQLQAFVEGESDGASLEKLDEQLLSAEIAVKDFPLVEVSEDTGYYVRRGQSVFQPNLPNSGFVRIRQEDGKFLGVGEISDDGRLQPRRLIADDS